MSDIKLGAQLYTLRDYIKNYEDAEKTFAYLDSIGINTVQISGIGPIEPEKVAYLVDKYNMDVCGPVALDLAVSEEACHHKHFTAPGAGRADILLVPNYEVGNGIGKAATLFGGAKNAGIILGAKVPIVLVSRADSAHSKLASIALGSVLAARMDLA